MDAGRPAARSGMDGLVAFWNKDVGPAGLGEEIASRAILESVMDETRLDISLADIPPLIEALERLEDIPPPNAASNVVSLGSGRLRISVETWKRLVRHLRTRHRLKHNRLVVKRARLKEGCGITYPPTAGGTITIRVSGQQTMQEQVDTLLHEWAHAVCFDRGRDEAHSDAWGKELAAIYRTWEEWNE